MLRRFLYSHRRGYRTVAFFLIGALSIGTYALVSGIPDGSVPGWVLKARHQAVETAIQGQQVIQRTRTARGMPFNPGDRFHTGMIGVASSPVTTELGAQTSHRTAANPVFAAAVVQMLWLAGVRPGDVVAVGETGSYPGFNLDVEAAVEAMGARSVTVSTVGSSSYGANEPTLTWPDMEALLDRAGVIHRRSVAVGPGGSLAGKDAATRLRLAHRSGRPNLPVLPTTQAVGYLDHLYVSQAARLHRPIKAFVDVGGSSAIIGSAGAETIIKPGLSRPRWTPFQAKRLGVVGRMALRGIPIVAMVNVGALAKQFGVPFDPHLPPTAKDIAAPPPNPLAVALALVFLMGVVVLAHRLGLFRVPNWELPVGLRRGLRRPGRAGPDEPARPSTPDGGRQKTDETAVRT